jgi:hypothetical protein
MSYLGKKMAADKISNAAKAASRNGDGLASATLMLVASIYLLGRDDLMKYVWVMTQAAAEQAAEEKHLKKGVAPPRQYSHDRVDEALEAAARLAITEGEETLSAIISFAHSLHLSKRDDLLRQLFEVAESLAHKGVGSKPPKEITIFEDAGGGEAS